MKRIDGSEQFPKDARNPVVALGNFDGVHLGHRHLLDWAREETQRRNGTTVVFTFEPHPVRILAPEQCPPLLQTLEQKLASLEALGVEICVVEPFTRAFAHQSAEDFFRSIIVEQLHAASLIVGYDFTFGLHRQGTTETLEHLGADHVMDVTILKAQFDDETLISSTNIRHMIAKGDILMANRLLGRPYTITGTVIPGRGYGRGLHARTANITTDNEVVPRDGVYITATTIPDESGKRSEALPSITSIGDNPTFPGCPHAIETHIIGQEMDILGRRIAIDFFERLRDQITFDSLDKLREQIAEDIEVAQEYHQRR